MISGKVWNEVEKPKVMALGEPVHSYDIVFMDERIRVETPEEADIVVATINFFARHIQDAIEFKGILDQYKWKFAKANAKQDRTGIIEWRDLNLK